MWCTLALLVATLTLHRIACFDGFVVLIMEALNSSKFTFSHSLERGSVHDTPLFRVLKFRPRKVNPFTGKL